MNVGHSVRSMFENLARIAIINNVQQRAQILFRPVSHDITISVTVVHCGGTERSISPLAQSIVPNRDRKPYLGKAKDED